MFPSGSPINQSHVVPANIPMNSLQCMAYVLLEIIIWVWKAVMWAFGSSVPAKVILGVMKFVGITMFMIVWENGMGRALTGIGGLFSLATRSPKRCRSLCNFSLALHSSSLFVATNPTRPWIGLVWVPARLEPQQKPYPSQPWMPPLSARECG